MYVSLSEKFNNRVVKMHDGVSSHFFAVQLRTWRLTETAGRMTDYLTFNMSFI